MVDPMGELAAVLGVLGGTGRWTPWVSSLVLGALGGTGVAVVDLVGELTGTGSTGRDWERWEGLGWRWWTPWVSSLWYWEHWEGLE